MRKSLAINMNHFIGSDLAMAMADRQRWISKSRAHQLFDLPVIIQKAFPRYGFKKILREWFWPSTRYNLRLNHLSRQWADCRLVKPENPCCAAFECNYESIYDIYYPSDKMSAHDSRTDWLGLPSWGNRIRTRRAHAFTPYPSSSVLFM